LKLVELPAPDNGRELLWAAPVGPNEYRIVSVPVFAYGTSRGTIVRVHCDEARCVHSAVVADALGATLRCYTRNPLRASELYLGRMVSDGKARDIRFGPATLFDPDIIALHVPAKKDVPSVISYLNELVARGFLNFWEHGDPEQGPEDPDQDGGSDEWKLIHPLPNESSGVTIVSA
jgi:hypothetical protein